MLNPQQEITLQSLGISAKSIVIFTQPKPHCLKITRWAKEIEWTSRYTVVGFQFQSKFLVELLGRYAIFVQILMNLNNPLQHTL